MFKRMSVPVLGLVENMTAFVCPHCGEVTEIFGRGGGERFAERARPRVPRRHPARHHGPPGRRRRRPGGRPARARSGGAGADRIAQAVAARMSVRAAQAADQPVLTIS